MELADYVVKNISLGEKNPSEGMRLVGLCRRVCASWNAIFLKAAPYYEARLKEEKIEDPLGTAALSLFYEENITFRVLYARYILPRKVGTPDFTQAVLTVTRGLCGSKNLEHPSKLRGAVLRLCSEILRNAGNIMICEILMCCEEHSNGKHMARDIDRELMNGTEEWRLLLRRRIKDSWDLRKHIESWRVPSRDSEFYWGVYRCFH